MNSMSKNYYKDDCEPCRKEKDKKQHCPTILVCGPVSGSVPIPDGLTTTSPLALTTVGVNVPKHCNPCVKIEFASTVTASIQGASSVSFTVTIFKNCANFLRIPIGSYSYAISGPGGPATSTNTFSFFVCDCNTCPSECCYYSAEITTSDVDSPGESGLASASISGAALSALVVDSGC